MKITFFQLRLCVCMYELVPLLFAEKQFGVVCLFRV